LGGEDDGEVAGEGPQHLLVGRQRRGSRHIGREERRRKVGLGQRAQSRVDGREHRGGRGEGVQREDEKSQEQVNEEAREQEVLIGAEKGEPACSPSSAFRKRPLSQQSRLVRRVAYKSAARATSVISLN
jgi:hypothetical protein